MTMGVNKFLSAAPLFNRIVFVRPFFFLFSMLWIWCDWCWWALLMSSTFCMKSISLHHWPEVCCLKLGTLSTLLSCLKLYTCVVTMNIIINLWKFCHFVKPPDSIADCVVAKHYNERKDVGLQERAKSRIVFLRNFNNWTKSVCIADAIQRLRDRNRNASLTVLDLCCGKGGDLRKWDKGKISKLVCSGKVFILGVRFFIVLN